MFILSVPTNRATNKNKLNMRLAGVTLPNNQRLEIALTAIYGIGRARAKLILDQVALTGAKKPDQLSPAEESRIRQLVETYKIEGDLKREIGSHIKRLKDIKCYRGWRHLKSLPVRGQRTKTNSRTRRGNVRKTMGSGRKKLEKK